MSSTTVTTTTQIETQTVTPGKTEAFSRLENWKARNAVTTQIVWKNVIIFAYLHVAAVYGVYLVFTSAMWQTSLFALAVDIFSLIGTTAGAHRLWSHRAYKAKLPLRALLAFLFTIAYQNDILHWAREHRCHHKYSDTHADPHNPKRGLFFSHIGWLLCKRHPEVIAKGKGIIIDDLLADPIVRFHRKNYMKLVLLCCFILPTVVPMYFWGETFLNAFVVAVLLRFTCTNNQLWLVNSFAHRWGNRPYDINIQPTNNPLTVLGSMGEGYHNYHHAFPYDYAASEFGIRYNAATAFIDAMAVIGQAYDRKSAPRSVVSARKIRTGERNVSSSNATDVD